MKKPDFEGLLKGLGQARHFARTGKLQGGRVHIPAEINVARIRAKAGATQAAFARQIGVLVATLRNWEQGRRMPDGPARVLLALLSKDPESSPAYWKRRHRVPRLRLNRNRHLVECVSAVQRGLTLAGRMQRTEALQLQGLQARTGFPRDHLRRRNTATVSTCEVHLN